MKILNLHQLVMKLTENTRSDLLFAKNIPLLHAIQQMLINLGP